MCVAVALHPPIARTAEDDVVGMWAAHIDVEGQQSPVGLQFERRGEEVRTPIIIPVFHGKAGFGPAKRVGNRAEVASFVFEYDPAARRLTTTLPAEFVSRHPARMTVTRTEAFDLPPKARAGSADS